ncbi:granulin a isoform X3 [Xyrauchen texanus]|uniref:granulin a isoform X2 n=1 Tax=Xyrauchen texanus TaxID=154827 RepID=UPI0022427741|nr:granulin a isoform X2 [Xyrauchen texanus]XP_051995508.1 granulin a isoform X3 [Xyrauchen texanus]
MLKLTVCLALVTLVACSQCPNSEVCEAGQSCCHAPTGEFSCCPFHHGECCEDHLHCCPEGMLCQVMESTCLNVSLSLPWAERTPTKQKGLPKSFRMIPSLPASENDIICPDGSCCPAEFSCLLLASSYGCCPVAQGIVCSDGKHCCPKGHECSADSSSCVKHKEPVETVLCRDGKSECPMDSTCCKTAMDDQWACCPMPRAVCCDDKVHCCPENSVCDVKSSKCLSSTNQELPMWAKFPARLRAKWEDHKLSTAVAVTPERSTEDEPTTYGQITTALNQMTTPSSAFSENSNFNVPCNDTVACPDNTTCCKTKDGGWACCPLPEAVCCDDFIHCCPHGTKCSDTADTCEDPSGSVPWFEKVSVRPISSQKVVATQVPFVYSNNDVPCNDSAACPDKTTCCKTKEGGWACCPLPEAVCCDDFIHCCPNGKKCNVAAGKCEDTSCSVPWLEQMPMRPISSQNMTETQMTSMDSNSDVSCDDTATCPDNTTCCKTKDGGWACCPLPEAVCCDDFTHCCPHGKKCNVAAGSCEDPSGSVPWFEKVPVRPISSQKVAATQVPSMDSNSNVPCDETAACPDNTTCCKTKDGGWACCPLPEAVCCDDFIHCCPHGKKCTADMCEDPSGSVPWFEKVPVQPINSQKAADKQVPSMDSESNVPCDGIVACPDETTCCKTKDGKWSCCPFPEAVCCKDKFHCCPKGTTCDLITINCNNSSISVPMSVIIPDHRQEQQKEVKNGVGGKGNYSGRVPCDAHTSCPDHTTCCLNAQTKKWGCCQLPKAVCCNDGEHCCPADYQCDESQVSCKKGDVVIPWYNKIVAQSTPAPSSDLSSVRCDAQSSCLAGSTCCHLSTGEWGCCPLPEAICCPDQEHCCPKGYECDLHGQSCVKSVWLQMDTVPLTHIGGPKQQPHISKKDIQCGGSYSCLDGETCCPTSETSWGCCPSPKAVCCDDKKHCCPAGYKCGEGGVCTQATGFNWTNWKHWRVFFSKKKQPIFI